MSKNKWIKHSITKRLSRYMILLIVTILLGGVFLYVVEQWTIRDYQGRLDLLSRKTDLVLGIQQNTTGAIAEMRGYEALRLPEFLDKMKVRQDAVITALTDLKKLPLSDNDKAYLDSIRTPLDQLFNEMWPLAKKLTDEGNVQEIIRLSADKHYLQQNDKLRQTNTDYAAAMRGEIERTQTEYMQRSDTLALVLALYFILIGGIVGFLAIRLARDIGLPLRALAISSKHYEDDKLFDLPYTDREDEIGYLTQSLQEMLKRIQDTEQDLIEQNDELLAQQEELIMQQDELHTTLMKMEENEGVLQATNQLNASLVNTLDRDALLESIIQNLVVIQQADKGAIVLLEPGYPHASIGIQKQQMEQYISTLTDGVFLRLKQEGKPYVVKREAVGSEKGYHEETIRLEDLYTPIYSSRGEMIALVTLTRLGRGFNEDAHAQAHALANQIALALEKLHTFETSERERVLNQEIIDSIREGVQLFDASGRLVQVNNTFCSWVGLETSELENHEMHHLFRLFDEHVEHPDELVAFMQSAVNGSIAENQRLIYELKGDSKRFIQVYFEKIYDEKGIDSGTVLVHRDMTREYEVDQMKSEFVSTVSHELRTPLSSVLGFTELMLNKELPADRQKKYLTTIHKEAKRLTQLINDFLDIQRMESGRQTYEMVEIDLLPILEEVLETFVTHSNKHQIQINSCLAQAFVCGDENKLRQVLTNMIGNAIKYSPDGGLVTVTVAERDGRLQVDIADQGLGIPKEAIGKLFSKFYRIDNSDRRKIGGTGLGLAICKEIMKAHDGAISVQSELGRGSTFSLHFANGLKLTRREAAAAAESGADGADKPRLLILEDDDSLAMLLREEMMENGFQVTHLQDGEQALQWIHDHSPDAVVIDIMLKDSISGWEVIERLKQNEATSAIPIFIATALDEKERGLSLGANEYLTKPYQMSKLSNMILQTLLRKEKSGVIMVPEEDVK
ncbi:MAG: ATP-binding protein [Tumebacillaceae bacterium]